MPSRVAQVQEPEAIATHLPLVVQESACGCTPNGKRSNRINTTRQGNLEKVVVEPFKTALLQSSYMSLQETHDFAHHHIQPILRIIAIIGSYHHLAANVV